MTSVDNPVDNLTLEAVFAGVLAGVFGVFVGAIFKPV
jgi:hypothetical protein